MSTATKREPMKRDAQKKDIVIMKTLIEEAVNKGIAAGVAINESTTKDAFKDTEKRLYAYPILRKKIEDDKDYLRQIEGVGLPGRDKSILRYSRSGSRVSPEEMLAVEIKDKMAAIARDEHEVGMIDNALTVIIDDYYYDTIEAKYFRGEKDEDVAENICCDPATVRRNRNRLVKQLSVMLYGAQAL